VPQFISIRIILTGLKYITQLNYFIEKIAVSMLFHVVVLFNKESSSSYIGLVTNK